MNRTGWRLSLVALLFAPLASHAADPEAILQRRAQEVAALITAEPRWAEDLFDASFLAAVPADKIRALASELHGKYGRIEAMNHVSQDSELSGKYEAILEKGFVMPVTISLTRTPPHSIAGLWFGPPAPGVLDLKGMVEELGKQEGAVSFGVYKLGDRELVPLVEKDADRALAIGSTFKLYVLGGLAREVEQGRRRLEETVRLETRYRSLPSGELHKWPAGSPVTLATLATLMISESDNTATDHLLFSLGREKVEAMLAEMGNSVAVRNIPFLATAEMFRLKVIDGGKAGESYLTRELASRKEYLAKELAGIPLSTDRIDTAALAKPMHIDTIEWFASARDLARAMQWLKRATDSPKTALLREILAVNPGLDVNEQAFPFVGYKGGSEAGVLNMTYLLRAKSGDWYALSCGWNDPQRALDEGKLAGLVTRTLSLLAKELEKPAAEAVRSE